MRRLLPIISAVLLLAVPGTAAAAPGATIGMVDCAAGGVVVTLASSGGPTRFVLQRGDVAVATHVQPAGPATTRIVPLQEGVPTLVTVRYGDSYVSSRVMRACDGATPPARTAAAAAAAPYPQPVVAATAALAPDAARPAPSPSAAPDAALPEATGSTASWWWLAAATAIALAAVIGIRAPLRARAKRRRELA